MVMVAVNLLSSLLCTYSGKAIYWLASHLILLQSCMMKKAAEFYLKLFAFKKQKVPVPTFTAKDISEAGRGEGLMNFPFLILGVSHTTVVFI